MIKKRLAVTAFNVYSDAGKLVGVADVQLPEVTNATTDISGAGIMGKMSLPLHSVIESMQATINWRMLEPSATFLSTRHEHTLVLMANVDAHNSVTGKYEDASVKIVLRGIPKKFSKGKVAVGEAMDVATEYEVTFYEEYIDNIRQVKIDKLNYIYEILGEDLMAMVRANIGEL